MRQAGELSCEIVAIVSNHSVLQPIAEQFGVPFHHLPIDKAMEPAAAKAAQELAVEALFEQEQVDLVVLARYMQARNSRCVFGALPSVRLGATRTGCS